MEQRLGLEQEIDEPGAGNRNGATFAHSGRERGNDLLGQGAGVEFAGLRVGEDTIGLKVTVARIGRPHLGTKALGLQAGGDGGGSQGLVQ